MKHETGVKARGRRAVWLLIAVLGCLTASLDASAADGVTYQTSWVIDAGAAGFYVAEDRGFYKKADIEVTVSRGFGSLDTVKNVASGAVLTAQADTSAVVVGRSQGFKVKTVFMYTNHGLFAIWTLKGAGIEKPKDLVGKSMGSTSGDVTRLLLPGFAERNGFKGSAVKTVLMNPAALTSSLLAGKVDTITGFVVRKPVYQRVAAKQGKELVSIPWHKFGFDPYSLGITAGDETIEKQAGLLRRFVQATQQGMKWVLDNPEGGVDALVRRHPERDKKLVLETLEIYHELLLTPFVREHGIGFIDENRMEETKRLIAGTMGVKADYPAADLYTNRFLAPIKP